VLQDGTLLVGPAAIWAGSVIGFGDLMIVDVKVRLSQIVAYHLVQGKKWKIRNFTASLSNPMYTDCRLVRSAVRALIVAALAVDPQLPPLISFVPRQAPPVRVVRGGPSWFRPVAVGIAQDRRWRISSGRTRSQRVAHRGGHIIASPNQSSVLSRSRWCCPDPPGESFAFITDLCRDAARSAQLMLRRAGSWRAALRQILEGGGAL